VYKAYQGKSFVQLSFHIPTIYVKRLWIVPERFFLFSRIYNLQSVKKRLISTFERLTLQILASWRRILRAKARCDPHRRAQIWNQLLDIWLDRRDNLYSRRAAANDSNRLVCQVVLNIPMGAVHQLPLELVEPRNIRVPPGAKRESS
jgi:hypothetical protein